jgi:hypothetical protein
VQDLESRMVCTPSKRLQPTVADINLFGDADEGSCFCFCGKRARSSLAESAREVDAEVDVLPALVSFALASFAFGAHLLIFLFCSLSHSACRSQPTRLDRKIAPCAVEYRHYCELRYKVQIAFTLSQLLTFSHARSSVCLIAFFSRPRCPQTSFRTPK